MIEPIEPIFRNPKDVYAERVNAAYERMHAHLDARGGPLGDEGEYDWERHQDVETAILEWLNGDINEDDLREQIASAWEACAHGYERIGGVK